MRIAVRELDAFFGESLGDCAQGRNLCRIQTTFHPLQAFDRLDGQLRPSGEFRLTPVEHRSGSSQLRRDHNYPFYVFCCTI